MKMENVGSYTLDNNRPTLSTLGLMDYPISLYIDRNGLIMVAYRFSSRILLLDSDLECERDILSKENHKLTVYCTGV